MLVNEMSSLTSPLGHSSKYSENRSGNENRTNLANHSRTDLLCLRSKHIASYHSPAGPLQCTDTRISFITIIIFSVVVSLRAKLRKNRKYDCHASYTGFHASEEPVTSSSKTSYFFPFFFSTCLFNKTMGHCLKVSPIFKSVFAQLLWLVIMQFYTSLFFLFLFNIALNFFFFT